MHLFHCILVANASESVEHANSALKRLKTVIKSPGTWDAHLIAAIEVDVVALLDTKNVFIFMVLCRY